MPEIDTPANVCEIQAIEQRSEDQPELVVLKAENLLAHGVHILASDAMNFHWDELANLYSAEAKAAAELEQNEKAICLSLFAQLLDIHFMPADKAKVWWPQWQTSTRRTIVPSDIKGPQTTELSLVLDKIAHPAVRARMADVVWTNNKRNATAATLAIEAYTECIHKVLNGELKGEPEEHLDVMDVCDHLERAFQIAQQISGNKPLPLPLQQVLEVHYTKAKELVALMACRRIAELGIYYEVLTEAEVAADLETLASTDVEEPYPYAAQLLYDYAFKLYHKIGNLDAARRCQLASANQMLAMRAQVSGAAAEAYWVRAALLALRRIPNTDEQRSELEKELNRLQVASTESMVTNSIDLGLKGEWDDTFKKFSQYGLAEGIRKFALVTVVPSEQELKQMALELAKSNPILADMPVGFVDGEGRTVAHAPGTDANGGYSKKWFEAMIARMEPLRRQRALGGRIEPARQALAAEFSIGEEHILPIVDCSFLIPHYMKPVVTVGFTRLLQGDCISAAYILTPQVEAMLRHVLQVRGHDPAKLRDDGTEEDKGLDGMFSNFRPQLEEVLTPTVVYYLEHLFEKEIGPGLRHQLAHGKVSAGGCYHSDMVYACWFLFHLVVRSVDKIWDKMVGPAITECEGTS